MFWPFVKNSFRYKLQKNQREHFYVFMIRCADGSLFTGVCDDPDEAVCEFNQGNLSKYVASRLPVLLVYSEEFMNEKDAVKRAIRIRRLGKMQKEILINEIPRFLVSV